MRHFWGVRAAGFPGLPIASSHLASRLAQRILLTPVTCYDVATLLRSEEQNEETKANWKLGTVREPKFPTELLLQKGRHLLETIPSRQKPIRAKSYSPSCDAVPCGNGICLAAQSCTFKKPKASFGNEVLPKKNSKHSVPFPETQGFWKRARKQKSIDNQFRISGGSPMTHYPRAARLWIQFLRTFVFRILTNSLSKAGTLAGDPL